MKNLGQMMQQAQKIQAKMAEMQEKLVELEISGSSGGGMVAVTLNGKNEMIGIKIDPALANGDEMEVLEDLIRAAFGDARSKVEAETNKRMSELTGGLQLPPGLTLPF